MNSYSLLQKSGIYSDRQLHKMKFSPLSRVFSVVLTVIVCGLDITASFMDLSVFVNLSLRLHVRVHDVRDYLYLYLIFCL